jgi:hypothetical protein
VLILMRCEREGGRVVRLRVQPVNLAIGVLLLATSGLAADAPAPTPAATPAAGDPLAAALDGVLAAGWLRTGEARTFDKDNLWELIDGDAERYVDAGVVKIRTVDFRFGGKLDATVEVYCMKDVDGARTIFRSESGSGTRPADVGDEARIHDTGLTFRAGRFFARVAAFEAKPEAGEAITDLGRALARRLARE